MGRRRLCCDWDEALWLFNVAVLGGEIGFGLGTGDSQVQHDGVDEKQT